MKKMMKKISAALAVTICAVVLFTACTPATEISLPPLADLIPLDESVAFLAAEDDTLLLDENIDRGFRLETYYTLGSGEAWPYDGEDGYEFLDKELEYYAEDNAREIQVYIYLCRYNETPLDDIAFNQMKAYFEYIRSKRMSMILRFSYEYDQTNLQGPTQEMLLTHLEQLRGFMKNNERLIRDTVTAYQFGCIGAWGEWGATEHKYNEKKVLNALLDMMPDGIYFQGRYMRVVNQTKGNDKYDYVGYHNDFLVGRPHPWNTAGDVYTSGDYKEMFKNAKYRINDGEMPWGGHTQEPDEKVDGKKFIKQCMEHSFATLSIKHNYRELRDGILGGFNIEQWKSVEITQSELAALNCPVDPAWFRLRNGETAKRTVFEYLRDFLGYRLTLSNYSAQEVNGETTVKFMLTNFGMGTPLTLNTLHFIAEDNEGNFKEYSVQGFDVKKLTSNGQIEFTLKIKGSIKGMRTGVRIVRACSTGDYAIRTANASYANGINYLN